jgi:hypothetical protein
MKKLLSFLTAGLLLLSACEENQIIDDSTLALNNELATVTTRVCASNDVLMTQMAANPGLKQKMENLEAFTAKSIANGTVARLAADGVIEIPVVVHVLWRTASENISDAQVQSQIDVLNEDFNATNSDLSNTPGEFAGVIGNVGVRFVLEATTRTETKVRKWGTNDAMKSARRGVPAWDASYYLNMWVVGDMGGILGYAQFPGGDPATDGVVMAHRFFGRVGTLSAPYHLGRTATHEVGHWMNLRHIWGDAGCGATDFVADTPDSDGPNFGCPVYPSVACSTTDMTMNYMDYTDDGCMYMFSNGQKDRMLAVFAAGGPRSAMGQ